MIKELVQRAVFGTAEVVLKGTMPVVAAVGAVALSAAPFTEAVSLTEILEEPDWSGHDFFDGFEDE